MNLFGSEIYNADAYQALPIHWAQEWGSMRYEHAKEQIMACGAGSQPDLASSRFCGIIQHLSLGSTGTDTLKSVPSFESLIAEANKGTTRTQKESIVPSKNGTEDCKATETPPGTEGTKLEGNEKNLIKSSSISQSTTEQSIKEVVPQTIKEEKIARFRSFHVMKFHKFRKDSESKWIAWFHKLPSLIVMREWYNGMGELLRPNIY
ncbi:hypothetical protein M514_03390 [Trichuris suis]|uniref:Uncharacterized protein n=1 Tax=Trichuris suis TaxID=68888 RepID=A0A085MEJ6_9BILA|nr:hypothetical protein M513_03390 [Trichuris suis]KFD68056.1 hypothetical protein M514_03390 [Trichuris suis]